jgi:hypothetical protein
VTRRRELGRFPLHRECCSIRKFHEGGCSVVFPHRDGVWVCLSGTSYQRSHSYTARLSDLLFAWHRLADGLVSSALELKGGGIDVSGVVQQLQHGADIIDTLLTGVPCVFLPVLVHRAIATIQVRELRKHRIQFRGQRFSIALMNCRGRISDLTW